MAHYHIVQIGAHLAEESQEAALNGARCLLVEPVPHLYAELCRKFAGHSNVEIENLAIAPRPGTRPLYYLRHTEGLPFWADQIGSLRQGHIQELAAQSEFPPQFREALVTEDVRCVTLADLLEAHGASHVYNLFVDTEGMDYEILCGFDFSRLPVARVVFERKHTDGVRKTAYRYNHLVDRLQQLGYVVRHLDFQNDEALLSVAFPELQGRALRYREEEMPDRWLSLHCAPTGRRGVHSSGASRGVVYVALGRRHYLEAQKSIHSLRLTNPDLPVTVFTDDPADDGLAADYRTVAADRSAFKLKVRALAESPYAQTIFLDSDTRVVGPLGDLFGALDVHDWCIAEAPQFHYHDGQFVFDGYCRGGVFNTGVLAFRKNESVRKLLEVWAACVEQQPDAAIRAGHFCDQWHFNNSIVGHEAYRALDVLVIGNLVWNLRSYALGQAIRDGLLPSARVLHARPWEARRFWGVDLEQLVAASLETQLAAR